MGIANDVDTHSDCLRVRLMAGGELLNSEASTCLTCQGFALRSVIQSSSSGATVTLRTTTPASEARVLRRAKDILATALPPRAERSRADAILRMVAPDGSAVRFLVEAKKSITPKSLLNTVDQLLTRLEIRNANALRPLVVSSYLSPRSRDLLEQRGISYADTTGNLRIVADRPGLFIEHTGATKDPWPDDQPPRSLRGRGAARSLRALVDFRPPYGVRDLAARAQVPPPTLSRVIDLLDREALLTRNDKGGVAGIDWAGAIRRWTQDYELRRSNRVVTYLKPRGLPALVDKLGKVPWRYAATGSVAAQRFAPIAASRTAAIYEGPGE
jgi:hypothetical protein